LETPLSGVLSVLLCCIAGVLYPEGEKPKAAPTGPLHTFTENAEVALPAWSLSKWCPRVVISLLVIRQIGTFTVSLQDVADVILANLDPGEFSRKRVGLKRA
jgi:hypothetical protein